MTTGVQVSSECITEFNEFKLSAKYRYIFFKMSDDKRTIVLEKKGGVEKTYKDFLAELPKEDCRYAVLDFHYETENDGKRNKIIFYNWAPDTAPTRAKMLYAGTKNDFKKTLVGIALEIQGTDMAEVDEQEVINRLKAFK